MDLGSFLSEQGSSPRGMPADETDRGSRLRKDLLAPWVMILALAGPTGGVACGGAANDGVGATGGAQATGGVRAAGGAQGHGASTGGGASAGRSGTGGAGGPSTGGAGGSWRSCKRGIATNVAPDASVSQGVGWYYNWSAKASTGGAGDIAFVPMIWGSGALQSALPASPYVLGFNEPNFHAQANLTAAEAAAAWPTLEAKAKALGAKLVSPAMNFCGPAASCNGTSPYQYLKDFFAACAGCQVDYVAVHWYNCDLPSLKDYLEPGGNLEGFEQFGKPIWLTEFSCDGKASVAEQEAYMRLAIPYLEGNPHVFRYAWFSADPIANARLLTTDGTATSLGKVYAALPPTCD